MKNRISFTGLCALLCTFLFLFSCSEKSEYMQTIPSDAAFVMTFDMKSLSEKGDVADWIKSEKNASLFNAFSSGMGEGTVKLWKKIQEDPEISGLSFTDNWVCFAAGETNPVLCILAKISDVDKWREVMKAMEAEGVATPISKEDNVESSLIGQRAKCLFDKNRVLLLIGQDATGILESKTAAGWFTQKKENSLLSNGEFSAFLKERKDVNYWYRMGALPVFFRSVYSAYLPDGILLGSLYSIGYCDFQKGKIEVTSGLRSDDKDSMKKLEEIFKMGGKQSGKFLKQIPANALYAVGMNLDGQKLYKFLSALPGLTQTQMNAIQSEDTKKIISSIDGDLLLSVIGLSGNASGFMGTAIPDVAVFAQVNDDYAVELIKRNLGILGVKEIGKNRYKLSMGEASLYFGLENKKNFFITNSTQVFENISNGMPESLANTPYASAFDKQFYSLVINMKEGIANLMPMVMGSYSSRQYVSLFELCPFTYLSGSGNGTNGNIEIFLSDDSKNAFAAILDWITVVASQER